MRTAWSLKEGECFNDPPTLGGLVVEVVDCEGSRDNQTYAVVDHPAIATVPYPGDGVLNSYAIQRCADEGVDQRVDPLLRDHLDFGLWAGPVEAGLLSIPRPPSRRSAREDNIRIRP